MMLLETLDAGVEAEKAALQGEAAEVVFGHVEPGSRDIKRIEIGAAEGDVGDALGRHRDDAVDAAVRIDAEHAFAFPAGAPYEALGIDGGAIGVAIILAVIEDSAIGDGSRF